jgi:hypothetical protein
MSISIFETTTSEARRDGQIDTLAAVPDMITKIKSALALAIQGSSQLDPRILAISGMSGRRYRMFINNLISSLPDARYLEVGSWAGSTLCSAINGNSVRAAAIDNWSQFGGPKDQFLANLQEYRTTRAYVNFIEMDFRQVDYSGLGPFNVYLFDGPHMKEDQYDGLRLAQPALDDLFVLIVDDWNWLQVREGTQEAIVKCGLTEYYSVELRTTLDDSHAEVSGERGDWHNGYYIALLSKATGASRPRTAGISPCKPNSERVPGIITLQDQITKSLYGRNPWANFRALRPPAPVIEGWNGDSPILAELAVRTPNPLAIDVGAFKGQATIFLARHLKAHRPDCCVISIDTFLGAPELWAGNHFFETRFGLPDIYATFLENVYYHDVSDVVVPLLQTPLAAARILSARGMMAGLVHLDASHTHDEVMRDAVAYWPLVCPGGWLVGDDYHESWPGVQSAAQAFAAAISAELRVDGPKWIIEKAA